MNAKPVECPLSTCTCFTRCKSAEQAKGLTFNSGVIRTALRFDGYMLQLGIGVGLMGTLHCTYYAHIY